MSHAYAMVAKHLTSISPTFDNAIPYHYTDPAKVDQIKSLVTKCAEKLDYGLPTCGTAHLRMNVIVKESPNKDTWQYSGGVLISHDVDAQIEAACERTLQANPGKEIKGTSLSCHILNEWERYSLVFELVITVGA